MSLPGSGSLLRAWTPFVHASRTRTRTPNLRKPAIPHWSRAVVLKLTKPTYKNEKQSLPLVETCKKKIKAEKKVESQINPFEVILAKEFLEYVDNAKLIAIFHKLPMTAASLYAARLQLNKINMQYLHHNNTIVKLALSGTKYESLLKLYESTTATFVGDQISVTRLLKLEKKIPGLVLLGGVVEGRFMNLVEMQQYAALPPLPSMQGQLVGLLNSHTQQLSQNLMHHQMELSSSLARYIDGQTSPQEKETENPEMSSE